MVDIEHIRSGDAILITVFGVSTAGTLLHVDEASAAFVYETDTGEQAQLLRTSKSVG